LLKTEILASVITEKSCLPVIVSQVLSTNCIQKNQTFIKKETRNISYIVMNPRNLQSTLDKFYQEKNNYYKQWVFDEPILISENHDLKLKELHRVLYKFIHHFVHNFKEWKHLMDLSEKSIQIIEALGKLPYEIGTFRADFVYDDCKNAKIIEITCRFALSSQFLSNMYYQIGMEKYNKNFSKIKSVDHLGKLPGYIAECSKSGDVFILKGKREDHESEAIIYKKILREAGRQVTEVHYSELENYISRMDENSWIVSELTFEEIESIEIELLLQLASLNLINDFRTILLIHNKQFFSVLTNKELQEECLTTHEVEFLNNFLIPTYRFGQNKELWQSAKENKDDWILKHKALGSSESIYAGLVTESKKWSDLMNSDQIRDYILQKWIPQTRIKATLDGKTYEDYITGTLMFFNNQYFGLGQFRASSFPVCNVIDDRKIIPLVLDGDLKEIEPNAYCDFINT
jgi:hypothetical protein